MQHSPVVPAHLSMIDWHSFLQVNLLPLRSLRGPPTIAALSPAMIPVLQSGSSFTKDRIDRVAPERQGTCDSLTTESSQCVTTVIVVRFRLPRCTH